MWAEMITDIKMRALCAARVMRDQSRCVVRMHQLKLKLWLEKMVVSKQLIWGCLLYYFKVGMSSLRDNAVNELLVLFIEIYFPYLNLAYLRNIHCLLI